jgi:stress response protein YsnF
MAELTDEVIRNLTPEQKENLSRLYELVMKESQIDEKIRKLFEKGFLYEPHRDGLAISVCEDWDDFTVMNAFKPPEEQHPLYREKVEIRKQIRETLRESVKMGLGYLRLVQKGCKEYKVNIDQG